MDELIALAVRRLAEKSGQTSPPETVQPQSVPPASAPRAPEAPPPTPRAPMPPQHGAEHGPLQGLFEGGNSLVRAVVAAELLSPPLSLRENAYWQKR